MQQGYGERRRDGWAQRIMSYHTETFGFFPVGIGESLENFIYAISDFYFGMIAIVSELSNDWRGSCGGRETS